MPQLADGRGKRAAKLHNGGHICGAACVFPCALWLLTPVRNAAHHPSVDATPRSAATCSYEAANSTRSSVAPQIAPMAPRFPRITGTVEEGPALPPAARNSTPCAKQPTISQRRCTSCAPHITQAAAHIHRSAIPSATKTYMKPSHTLPSRRTRRHVGWYACLSACLMVRASPSTARTKRKHTKVENCHV